MPWRLEDCYKSEVVFLSYAQNYKYRFANFFSDLVLPWATKPRPPRASSWATSTWPPTHRRQSLTPARGLVRRGRPSECARHLGEEHPEDSGKEEKCWRESVNIRRISREKKGKNATSKKKSAKFIEVLSGEGKKSVFREIEIRWKNSWSKRRRKSFFRN